MGRQGSMETARENGDGKGEWRRQGRMETARENGAEWMKGAEGEGGDGLRGKL